MAVQAGSIKLLKFTGHTTKTSIKKNGVAVLAVLVLDFFCFGVLAMAFED